MRLQRSILASILTLTSLVASPLPAAASPFIEFLGQRFVSRVSTMDAFFGVAFDPVNRRVLSAQLKTECGNALMSSETADNGVAWDPVTQEFWYIGNARDVYHYVGGAAQLLFSLPENFTVPGEGPATLDRPEGLAIDMNHIYVVDAGDGGVRGDLAANEWFKFTRDGTPVKSSASTDFQTELIPHFEAAGDCVVDGLTWIPPGSPYGEGLFLMALEHSGIQVLDDQGMYVDRILWQDQGIPAGAVPFGFAGITIDPLLGNLYLVENGGKLRVWERITSTEPMTLLYGSAVARMHQGPESPCNWQATYELGFGSGLPFGLSYRDVDGLLWTVDFGSGEAFTMSPHYAEPVSMGMTGIINSWGMAYDDERDVFYVFREGDNEIYALDPTTLQPTVLSHDGTYVRELAFNSDDQSIYGVGYEDPANQDYDPALIRFDRDTGEPTMVGLTIGVAGLAYDRISQKLVGITNQNGGQLYSIDPVTAQAQLLSNDVSSGWEGLAAIFVDSPLTGIEPVVAAGSTLGLRAFPNPMRAPQGSVAFRMQQSGPVRASVIDLAGRRVASLHDGLLSAGPHELRWNGRDARGLRVANGMYFIRLSTPWESSSTKLTVLR